MQLKSSCVVLWQRNSSPCFSFNSSAHACKHLLATQRHSGQEGEPTHMQKHNDAHGVMQGDSGCADSLQATGMWVQALSMHTHTHRDYGRQVWRSMACYSCSQRSQAAASQGDEGKRERENGNTTRRKTPAVILRPAQSPHYWVIMIILLKMIQGKMLLFMLSKSMWLN